MEATEVVEAFKKIREIYILMYPNGIERDAYNISIKDDERSVKLLQVHRKASKFGFCYADISHNFVFSTDYKRDEHNNPYWYVYIGMDFQRELPNISLDTSLAIMRYIRDALIVFRAGGGYVSSRVFFSVENWSKWDISRGELVEGDML